MLVSMRLGIGLGVCVLLVQPAATQQAPVRPSTLTALDYAEIKRVVGQYNLGWDSTGRVDHGSLVGKAFTADAVFFSPTGPWIGSDRIAAEAAKARSGISHWVSNLLIDAVPDGSATSWSAVLLSNVAASGRPVALTGGGILHEAFVKMPEGWRLKYRRYEAVGTTPTINWPQPEQGHFATAPDSGPPVKGSTAPAKLTSADYIEIEQLYARNNVALDSGADEGRRFARTFTPDGVMAAEDNSSRIEGAMLAQLPRTTSKEPGLHTWMSNLMIEPSPGGAIGRVYVITANLVPRSAGPDARHTIAGGRRYTDVLVKTPEGWRFKRRTYKAYATPL